MGLSTQIPLDVPTRDNIADQRFGKEVCCHKNSLLGVSFRASAQRLTAVCGNKRIRTYSPIKEQIYSLPRLSNCAVFPCCPSFRTVRLFMHLHCPFRASTYYNLNQRADLHGISASAGFDTCMIGVYPRISLGSFGSLVISHLVQHLSMCRNLIGDLSSGNCFFTATPICQPIYKSFTLASTSATMQILLRTGKDSNL